MRRSGGLAIVASLPLSSSEGMACIPTSPADALVSMYTTDPLAERNSDLLGTVRKCNVVLHAVSLFNVAVTPGTHLLSRTNAGKRIPTWRCSHRYQCPALRNRRPETFCVRDEVETQAGGFWARSRSRSPGSSPSNTSNKAKNSPRRKVSRKNMGPNK